jgi:hypothetical protein
MAKYCGLIDQPACNDPEICSAPQAPEDRQAPGYSNMTPSNWLRGMGKGEAEGKPGFDKTRSGGK